MATTKTPEHEAKNAGKAAADTAESTGKTMKETGDRTAQATAHQAERATETASDAAERTTKAAADTAGRMAETTAQSLDAESMISTTRESIAVATKTQQQAVDSIERASASMLTGATEMQKEIAGFVSERIRQDLETQQELLSCRTLEEVGEVQSRFFRTTLDQYSAEATVAS
jgi:uncharacterized protein Yka (UPF0111/DUF47 family)